MPPTAPPLAVFRFDASPEIGGGHAMRCLSLARQMIAQGWRCRFAVGPGTLETVHGLAAYESDCLHLNDDAAEDLRCMAEALQGAGCDLLIADHYGRDAGFETACRAFAGKIMVIDDVPARAHDCDILLDQNLGRRHEDYAGLLPASCQMLLGPSYALLRADFASRRDEALARRHNDQPISRILVSFGMADPAGITLQTLRALQMLQARDAWPAEINIDVVIGAGAPTLSEIHALAAEMGDQVRVLSDVEDMAGLMLAADLAIGAGGTTSWERCTLGLPAVIVVMAENQRLIANALADVDAVKIVGDVDGINEKQIADAVSSVIDNRVRRQGMALAAAAICDGEGCRRVVEELAA